MKKPDASYRSLTATFLALLECGFVAQAQALAGSLPWRRLSSALLAVLQVEVAHHAGGALEEGRSARIALERRIDVASAEIEACIAALVRTPASATVSVAPGREGVLPTPPTRLASSASEQRIADSPPPPSLPPPSPLLGWAAANGGGGGGGGGFGAWVTQLLAAAKSEVLRHGESLVACGDVNLRAVSPATLPPDRLLSSHGLMPSPKLARLSSCRSSEDGIDDARGRSEDGESWQRLVALLREVGRLLSLRRYMAEVYMQMCAPLADGDAAALEARVCALRTSYLSMVPSELAPLRSSTLELSVTEQLLRAQAMLGTCRLREAICALVAADAELGNLHSPRREELREAALTAAAAATRGSLSLVPRGAPPEPYLFRVLRAHSAGLRRKAALYFHGPLRAPLISPAAAAAPRHVDVPLAETLDDFGRTPGVRFVALLLFCAGLCLASSGGTARDGGGSSDGAEQGGDGGTEQDGGGGGSGVYAVAESEALDGWRVGEAARVAERGWLVLFSTPRCREQCPLEIHGAELQPFLSCFSSAPALAAAASAPPPPDQDGVTRRAICSLGGEECVLHLLRTDERVALLVAVDRSTTSRQDTLARRSAKSRPGSLWGVAGASDSAPNHHHRRSGSGGPALGASDPLSTVTPAQPPSAAASPMWVPSLALSFAPRSGTARVLGRAASSRGHAVPTPAALDDALIGAFLRHIGEALRAHSIFVRALQHARVP